MPKKICKADLEQLIAFMDECLIERKKVSSILSKIDKLLKNTNIKNKEKLLLLKGRATILEEKLLDIHINARDKLFELYDIYKSQE